jgi:hypothetical protein
MAHECPFGPDGHKDLTAEDDISYLEEGICPLCIHDFVGEQGVTTCIECGHTFEVVGEVIKVIPLAD